MTLYSAIQNYSSFLPPEVIGAFCAGSLIFLWRAINAGYLPTSTDSYQYVKNGALFTPAEQSFLSVLESTVGDEYRVFGKIRIADVISPAEHFKRYFHALNRISSNHFDYVLCDTDTLEVVAVVELDDKKHNKQKSKKRDALVESVCGSASIPFLRFKAQGTYSPAVVKLEIDQALAHLLKSTSKAPEYQDPGLSKTNSDDRYLSVESGIGKYAQ